MCAKSFSCLRLFLVPWTASCKAPLFMGFSRQEYWSGLPFSFPEDLPDPRIKLTSHISTCIGRQVLYHQCHLGITGIHVGTQNRVTKKYMKEYHYHIIFYRAVFFQWIQYGGCFQNIECIYSLGVSVLPYRLDSTKLYSNIPKGKLFKELNK